MESPTDIASESESLTAARQRPRAPLVNRRRQLLNACRDRLVEATRELLPAVLDEVDDALFDMADKSETNQTQTLYLDAMREVRLKRPGMERTLHRALARRIDQRIEDAHKPARQDDPAVLHKLGLVDDDELEQTLAVTNMTGKIRALCQEELYGLDLRAKTLLGVANLEESDNPLGPAALSEAVRDAVNHIESGIEIRLIVLKLFDRFLSQRLPGVYQSVNGMLVDNGVLVKLPERIRRAPHTGVSRRPAQEASDSVPPEAAPSGVRGHGAASARPGQPPVHGEYLPHDQFDPGALLSTLQALMQLGGHGNLAPSAPALIGLSALQTDAACMAAGSDAPSIGSVRQQAWSEDLQHGEQLMIDIVEMMFEYVLDDASIPDSVKALIARLQIPYLKIAMLDKGMFSRKFHPARKLLNALATAGIGCPARDAQQDPVYKHIAHTVQRLLEEFEDDLSLLDTLHAELQQALDRHRSGAVATSNQATLKLQRIERTRAARQAARHAVAKRVKRCQLPSLVRRFLERYWQGLLVITHARRGADSGEWRVAIKTMDELIWSVLPRKNPEERRLLVERLPKLLKRLNDGMRLVSMPEPERDALIAELASCHATVVRPAEPDDGATASRTDLDFDPEKTLDNPLADSAEHQAGVDLSHAVCAANLDIFEYAQLHRECRGMGTTIAAIWFDDGGAHIAHVGDSRIYRLRAGQLRQLSKDHSLRQELVDRGFYTAEEAEHANNKNYVTRALGVNADVQVDRRFLPAAAGDLYLLCSDGLSDVLDADAITQRMHSGKDLQAVAEELIDAANARGGPDNISVLLALLSETDNDSLSWSFIQRSDPGRQRDHNEDCVLVMPEHGLGLVADGMGGHQAGEVASRMAVRRIAQQLNPTGTYELLPEEHTVEPATACAAPVSELTGEAFMHALLRDQQLEIDEIVTDPPPHDAEDSAHDPPTEAANDEFDQLAAGLDIGAWIELSDADGQIARARLTWISSVTGALLFTDHGGHQVAEFSLSALADALRENKARTVEGIPVFDRAMNNMMARLNARMAEV